MKKHTRQILFALLFVAVYFCGDRAFSFILSRALIHSDVRFSRIYTPNDYDTLILGSSRGDKSFVPALFRERGMHALQLSYQGQSTEICLALLEDFLRHNQSLKRVFFDISSLSQPNTSIKGLKPYAYFSRHLARIAANELPNFKVFSHFSKLYVVNGEAFWRSLYFLGRSDQDIISIYTTAITERESLQRLAEGRYDVAQPLPNNLRAISRLSDICKQRGINLILLYPPMNPVYANACRQDMDRFVAACSSRVDDPVYDFSEQFDDCRLFADLSHMNYRGATAFTTYMLQRFVPEGR